ncbi:MAG: HlyD family efflux transporter periplasmic adaptor subunit [Desulfobacterales bacterium]|nr:HlyD family efflux transporter periplasmic adaptor subunit [Desulfobacterales bacterium]
MNIATRRKLFIAIIISAVVLATVYGFIPEAEDVDLVNVSRGSLAVTIEEEGRTRLKERFVVSAPTAGYIRRITAKAGDPVKKGETVAVLEPMPSQALDPRSRAETEAAVSAARAAFDAAQEKERASAADEDYLEKRLKRFTNLYLKGYAAKDQLDQTESEFKKTQAVRNSAKAAADAARFELERAKATLQNFHNDKRAGTNGIVYISSPADGRIFKIRRESAGAVGAGEPIMDIGNQENLEVITEVLSSDAVKIKKGTPVLFKRWGGDKPLSGEVKIVEPAGFTKFSSLGVEEQRVFVITDITSPPETWRVLGDGYRLESHFIVWERKDVLQVPSSSLFRSGEKWAVFVNDKGRARLRAVEVGQRNGLTAEIISGIKANDKVIAHPGDSISDGTRIRAGK